MSANLGIEARGVTKIFGRGAEAVRALHRVSVQVHENEFFTLLGPSGCGKTTLLRLIAGFDLWGAALDRALGRIADYRPEVLVVSLGVDTYEGDPISHFRLKREDYPLVGARISALGRPTLFVMAGGDAVAEIGVNAVNVLSGFEGGS